MFGTSKPGILENPQVIPQAIGDILESLLGVTHPCTHCQHLGKL